VKPSVFEIASQAREIFCRLLVDAVGTSQTKGSCLYASVLLSTLINQFGDCTKAVVRGGDGAGDGGYCAPDGSWYGHYWVEVAQASNTLVADITADQFGLSPVLVLPMVEAHSYVAGNQNLVDTHIAEQFPAHA